MNPTKTSTPDTQCSKNSKLPKYQQPEAVRLSSQTTRGYAASCNNGSSATGACQPSGSGNVGGACLSGNTV